MTLAAQMNVILRLPTRVLYQGAANRLTAVAPAGAFGMLPNHVDFVTALVPSVMTLHQADGTEKVFGVDEGILVKKGHDVSVAVLRAVQGDDLDSLQETVNTRFLQMDEDERQARSALSRLEADMVRRFAELQRTAP